MNLDVVTETERRTASAENYSYSAGNEDEKSINFKQQMMIEENDSSKSRISYLSPLSSGQYNGRNSNQG